jgi:hypothetical protein
VKHRLFASLVLPGLLLAFSSADGKDQAPRWLIDASNIPTPEPIHGAPAVELVREGRVQVLSSGALVAVERRAVRVLTREGRRHAADQVYYVSGSGTVRQLEAWILRPGGDVKAFGKDDVVDAEIAENDIYQEQRVRWIDASSEAEVGAVFGCESVVEYISPTPQIPWSFQGRIPVVRSRFSLELPAGWDARSTTFNHSPIEPQRQSHTYHWSAADLPYLPDEPWSPPLTSLAPRLAVTLLPPAGEPKWNGTRFESWTDVARWVEALAEPQSAPTPALTAKAKALVEGRAGEWERIEAVAEFVQKIHYISIQTRVAHGGGYRPHSAGDVFAKSYGDCKDKANLFRTMLREVGIRAHLLLITADDRSYVREEWPSPWQFNHCIAAVEVSDSVRAPAVMERNDSRFLIFDPTDTATPLGQLPFEEQSSLALLIAGPSSGLVRVPGSGARENGITRTIDGRLGPDRALIAKLVERAVGRDATERRRSYRSSKPADYRKSMERWISEGIPGASLTTLTVRDQWRENRFDLEIEFHVPGYARTLPGGLLLLQPPRLEPSDWKPRAEKRRMPILLPSSFYIESTKLQVPDGFTAEECPDSVRTESPFGTFRISCGLEAGRVGFHKELELKGTQLPAAEFDAARRFFDGVRAAGQASVVLAPATPPAPASSP